MGKMYLNHYECDCGAQWTDEWDCMCDDRCPSCDCPCCPHHSEEYCPQCGDLCTPNDEGDPPCPTCNATSSPSAS